MKEIREQIKKWKETAFAPQQNDVLYTLHDKKNAVELSSYLQKNNAYKVSENKIIARLYKQHQASIKEAGSPIFGVLEDCFCFHFEKKEYQMPFLVAKAGIQKNKLDSSYEIKQEEDSYVNPLLLHLLEMKDIPLEVDKAQSIIEEKGLSVQLKKGLWGANFHPHRFVLQKEWETLYQTHKFSPALLHFFGLEDNKKVLSQKENLLFPADESQRKAIDLVKTTDLVLQGPPGTGKSQVIVNLLGKALQSEKGGALIAEKGVALSVIYNQLKKKNLHYFAAFYHHKLQSKEFVRSLEKTWKYLESLPKKNISLLGKTELLTEHLDFVMERLRQPDLIGGISLSEFYRSSPHFNNEKYATQKPSLKQWKRDKQQIEKLQQNGFDITGKWILLKWNKSTDLETLFEVNSSLIQFLREKELEALTLTSLEEKIKLGALVSHFYWEGRALPPSLFETGSHYNNRFKKTYKKYLTVVKKIDFWKDEEKNWKRELNLSEIENYLSLFNTTSRWSFKKWKAHQEIKKLTLLPLENPIEALNNLLELKKNKAKIIQLEQTFINMEIPADKTSLDFIHLALKKTEETEPNNLKKLLNFTSEERLEIKNLAHSLLPLKSKIRFYYLLDKTKPILSQLEDIEKSFHLIIQFKSVLKSVSEETINLLRITKNIAITERTVFASHWSDFIGRYPELSHVNGEKLVNKIKEIDQTFKKESQLFGESIRQKIKQNFESYHKILQTPAYKLDEQQKQLKKELRKGKSILIKAFAKKRVFPSVRQLMESKARHWIRLLHPLFLCSPYSLAKSIPMEYPFDLVIFDEASQIPISHAVGGIQRANRVVISGDQQQMAPHFYFQKKEHQQADLLHHASYYWKNSLLTHHYRSKFQELIAYSNQYFYGGKLLSFPLPETENPMEVITTNGIFSNRKNEKEAQIIAKIIIEKIKKKEMDFGLVAFSQTQLEAIIEKIPSTDLEKIEQSKDCFMQALEEVQGEQCNHLIISLGYAYNENGKFRKQFGPINQEQGHRRLNVLMSRAISKITFVRSVNSSDFKLSENEGVEKLRKLMYFLEQESAPERFNSLPADIEKKGNKLTINNFPKQFATAQSILDLYNTYTQRGWEVKIKI